MSFYMGGSEPMNGNGARRSYSTTDQPQYQPFMLGGSSGYCVGNGQPVAPTTISAPHYLPAARTSSLNNYGARSVQECMTWPASVNNKQNTQTQSQNSQMSNYYYSQNQMPTPFQAPNSTGYSGDSQFCASPPKVYMSAPGMDTTQINQGIQCQVAPLGTDPRSLMRPMQALNVNVKAPADLFAGGNPGEPRTISISPAQLYGGMAAKQQQGRN